MSQVESTHMSKLKPGTVEKKEIDIAIGLPAGIKPRLCHIGAMH